MQHPSLSSREQATAQLDRAVAEVFEAMLGTACLPVGPPTTASLSRCAGGMPHLASDATSLLSPPCLTASIRFSGAIAGVCNLHVALPAAAHLASTLVGTPAAQVTLSTCTDTAGELCNMIAGIWKSALAPIDVCAISCPVVRLSPFFGSTITSSHSPGTTIRRLYRFASQSLSLSLTFD